MSFAKDVKEELSKIFLDDCCKNAELHAMLRLNSSIVVGNKKKYIEFTTMNSGIARRFFSNIKDLYQADIEIKVKKQTYLEKKNIYLVEVKNKVDEIISEHQLLESILDDSLIVEKKCCKASYLRGAFLCSGSITEPNKSYHLEIACSNSDEIYFLQRILNYYELNAKISKRRNLLILYIKNSDKISDFLKAVGASNSLMVFEDIRIRKDFNTMYNRLSICQTYNDMKTIDAANEQLKAIKYLEKNLNCDKIPVKIKQVMELRKKYPQENLQKICEYSKLSGNSISKSCLYHRLNKIKEMVEEIKKNK